MIPPVFRSSTLSTISVSAAASTQPSRSPMRGEAEAVAVQENDRNIENREVVSLIWFNIIGFMSNQQFFVDLENQY